MQFLLVGAGTAADQIADAGEQVLEDVGAEDSLAGDDAAVAKVIKGARLNLPIKAFYFDLFDSQLFHFTRNERRELRSACFKHLDDLVFPALSF